MKLQSLGVLFVLIILPIILVLTYYVQLQVDTVELQSQYDTKLLDSTYDAMSSFELNTANEDLSTVSDSLRTIVEASNNVFINTLATNLGLSNANKSTIEPYIPAILYTLYDGYYISSPTKTAKFVKKEDGTPAIIGEEGVKYEGGKYVYHEVPKQEPDHQGNLPQNNFDKNNYIKFEDLPKEEKTKYGDVVLDLDASGKEKYRNETILKSYIPYSARYHQVDNTGKEMDITCVYTLDNFVSIEGSIKNNPSDEPQYYTKSGYLIGDEAVNIEVTGLPTEIKNYSQEDAKSLIESGNYTVKVIINDDTDASFVYDKTNAINSNEITRSRAQKEERITELRNVRDNAEAVAFNKVASDEEKNKVLKELNDKASINLPSFDSVKVRAASVEVNKEINNIQYELDLMSAASYYAQASIFSRWVKDNLGTLRENSIIEISGEDYASIQGIEQVNQDFYSKSDTDYVFNIPANKVVIKDNSNFYRHKTGVIRDSIQYNLNLAMSTYNLHSIKGYEYSMPVLSTEEWNQIINNISIVSFMQGFRCGLKTYNNYMVVSSTNNEFMPIDENIYYIDKTKFNDENQFVHRINCKTILDNDVKYSGAGPDKTSDYLSFTSKEIKYDKIFDKHNSILPYKYDHRNYACYDCIIDGNHEDVDIFSDKLKNDDPTQYGKMSNLRKAYYIAMAKERNNTYKMNAFNISEGYEFVFDKESSLNKTSTLPESKIKGLEIVVGPLYVTDKNEATISCKVEANSKIVNDETYSIPSNSLSLNTLYVPFNPAVMKDGLSISRGALKFIIQNTDSSLSFKEEGKDNTDKDAIFKESIKSIKVIYK